jgi:hypothetical protein
MLISTENKAECRVYDSRKFNNQEFDIILPIDTLNLSTIQTNDLFFRLNVSKSPRIAIVQCNH